MQLCSLSGGKRTIPPAWSKRACHRHVTARVSARHAVLVNSSHSRVQLWFLNADYQEHDSLTPSGPSLLHLVTVESTGHP